MSWLVEREYYKGVVIRLDGLERILQLDGIQMCWLRENALCG